MATPVNDVHTTLSAQFVHGTDVTVDGVDCSLFESTGYLTVRTDTWDHYARYQYTGKAANQLTGLTLCTLGNVESEAAYTFPIGSILEVGAMAEYVNERIVGPASATDGHFFKADGVTGKLAKAEAIAMAELGSLITQATMTLYVAKTGNDADGATYGGTSAHPFLTIGAAIDYLPALVAHASEINVAPGVYTENITTPLSRLIIIASLAIQAKDLADREWWATGTATAGAATTIDIEAADILGDDEWNDAAILTTGGTGPGQIRTIVDTDDANSRLTVAAWDTNPASGTTYILTGAVKINGTVSLSGIKNLTFQGIQFGLTGWYSPDADKMSVVAFYDCVWISTFYDCRVNGNSYATFTRCGIKVGASLIGLIYGRGSAGIVESCVFYGAKSSDYGLYMDGGSFVYVTGTTHVRHCATGVYASGGSIVSAAITYTDNTTNATPAAASDPAYIADVT